MEFKKLQKIIEQDRKMTDLTERHNWFVDNWLKYSELRNELAIEHDTLRYNLLFNKNWTELNEERINKKLDPISSFEEKKDYIVNEMNEIDLKLNEVDLILTYLTSR